MLSLYVLTSFPLHSVHWYPTYFIRMNRFWLELHHTCTVSVTCSLQMHLHQCWFFIWPRYADGSAH